MICGARQTSYCRRRAALHAWMLCSLLREASFKLLAFSWTAFGMLSAASYISCARPPGFLQKAVNRESFRHRLSQASVLSSCNRQTAITRCTRTTCSATNKVSIAVCTSHSWHAVATMLTVERSIGGRPTHLPSFNKQQGGVTVNQLAQHMVCLEAVP